MFIRFAFITLLLALLLPAAATAAPGDLDLSFGNGGVQTTNFGPGPSGGNSVLRQPDGKIVVAGDSVGGLSLARYDTDGSLDTSFGGDGRQTTSRFVGGGNGVALQEDGKIVAVGSGHVAGSGGSGGGSFDSTFALTRHHPDGSLDTSFGEGGMQFTDFDSNSDQATAVAVQEDGKIVVVGSTDRGDGFDEDFAVARYDADGSPDTTFSGDGKLTTDFGSEFVGATGVAVQDDDKIVVVGQAGAFDGDDFAVARYDPDGSLDTSFSGDGKQTTDFERFDRANGVALQDDGKIVVVGDGGSSFGGDFAVARYNLNGSLDTSFSDDGKQTTDFDVDDEAFGVALQPDDDTIVVVGETNGDTAGGSDGFAVARYDTDGELDSAFSDDGMQTTDFGGGFSSPAGVATGADGKIAVAGTSATDFAVALYDPDGSLDTAFSGDGMQTTTFDGNDAAYGVAVQADDKIVAVGGGAPGGTIGNNPMGRGTFAVARYTADGSPDASFSDDGKQTTDFGGYAPARDVAAQADGRIVAVGSVGDTGSDFALARYNPDGSPDPSFAEDGEQTTAVGGYAGASAVALQDDGKVVAAGFGVSDSSEFVGFALARYNADGSPDTSFSDDGKQTTDFGNFAGGADVALQSDGKVVVVGQVGTQDTGGDFAVARYNQDGSPDTSFSDDGKQTTDFGSPFAGASGVAVQSDGRIVVVGSGGDPNTEFALARYNPDGSLDASFSGDGKQTTEVGAEGGASSVALQGDGKLVVVGGAAEDVVLARYLPDGSLDATFSADGTQTTDLGGVDSAAAVALQTDGGIVIAGEGPGVDSPDFVVARYEGDPDTTPPETSTIAGPAEGSVTEDSTPTFEFASSEAGSTFACQIDGGAAFACESPFTPAALADGPHSFAVAATDAAGNVDPTPATRSFTVRRPGPPPGPDGPPVIPPVVTPPAVTPPQAVPKVKQLLSLPSSRRCASRRKFTVRVRRTIRGQISRVTIFVNGKRVKRVKGRRIGLPIDLRGLPKGRVRIRLKVELKDGRVATDTRRYRTCAKKKRKKRSSRRNS